MKSYLAVLALSVCGLPLAARADQIVNIDATSAAGTSITLAAGKYEVSVIGTQQGGEYNGWDYATANFGTPAATPAPGAWVDSFDINLGANNAGYFASGYPQADSALDELAIYQSSVLNVYGAPADKSLKPDTAIFYVPYTQTVNFTVADYLFVDNWGGVSLNIDPLTCATATPEPSTFGLIGLALAGTVTAFRRKLAR